MGTSKKRINRFTGIGNYERIQRTARMNSIPALNSRLMTKAEVRERDAMVDEMGRRATNSLIVARQRFVNNLANERARRKR